MLVAVRHFFPFEASLFHTFSQLDVRVAQLEFFHILMVEVLESTERALWLHHTTVSLFYINSFGSLIFVRDCSSSSLFWLKTFEKFFVDWVSAFGAIFESEVAFSLLQLI